MSTITERVAAGAAFLDEHDPDWWRADVERAIDLDKLDLGEPNVCVLGQRCPIDVLAAFMNADPAQLMPTDAWRSYLAYAKHLSGLGVEATFTWSVDRGFNTAESDDDDATYSALTAEWKRVITERRAGQ